MNTLPSLKSADHGLKVDPAQATFSFASSGIQMQGGGPLALILVGSDERPLSLKPTGQPRLSETCTGSLLGPLFVRSLCWPVAPNMTLTWRIGSFETRRGFTLQAALYNGTDQPFRLKEFSLISAESTGLRLEGDPADWHLQGLIWEGGTLAELLPSKNELTRRMWAGFNMPVPHPLSTDEKSNDGHWRSLNDVATLYTDKGRQGIYAGAVGEESDVRFDWHVEGGRCQLDVISAMSEVRVDPGETRCSETVLFLAEPYAQAAETYFRWLAATLGCRTHRGPVTGWCSWYDRFNTITAEQVIGVAQAVADRPNRLPLQVIQIDDGYQQQAGQWECNDTFPDGWKPVVEAICHARATPGIWFAPLAVHESVAFPNYTCARKGRLLDVHPDWFQRLADGTLSGSAGNWGDTAYWLDPTHPGVQAFIRRIMRQGVLEGFRYFKIDFNTVAGRLHNPKKTHLQAYRDLYRLYREGIGEESYLLSCSGLTRATIGLVDASRIGPDSPANWNAPHPCCIRDCIPSVANSAFANGILYANDPDVTYTRPGGLTVPELQVWHSFVGLLGGAVLVSSPFDNPDYQTEESLRLFEILTPPAKEHGVPLHPGVDRMCRRFGLIANRPWGRFASVLIYNPLADPADIPLDLDLNEIGGNRCFAWSFWAGQFLGIIEGGHVIRNLGSHSGLLLRLTPVPLSNERPVIVGSDLHITMGAAELRAVRSTPSHLEIELTGAGSTHGALYIHSSSQLRFESGCGIARIDLTLEGENIWKLALTDRDRKAAQIVRIQTDSQ